MKPQGFWLSDDDCEHNWRSWCLGESFSLGNLACAHDVLLRAEARILRLGCAPDIDLFTREFVSRRESGLFMFVRWRDVAAQYDGIIITPYIWSRRLDGNASWYYGWDCASGCIWNADAIERVTVRVALGVEP